MTRIQLKHNLVERLRDGSLLIFAAAALVAAMSLTAGAGTAPAVEGGAACSHTG